MLLSVFWMVDCWLLCMCVCDDTMADDDDAVAAATAAVDAVSSL